MKFIQTYFSESLWAPLYLEALTFGTLFSGVRTAALEQRLGWLSFGCASTCILHALLPLAISQHRRKVSRVDGLDNAERRSRDYHQMQSYSDLGHAISKKNHLEVVFACMLLINLGFDTPASAHKLHFDLDSLVHFSGLWAALKELYYDPSVTDDEWMDYESMLLRCLGYLQCRTTTCLRLVEASGCFPLDVRIVQQMAASILSEILDWPLRSLGCAEHVSFQRVRRGKLRLALHFFLLDNSAFSCGHERSSLQLDRVVHVLQSLMDYELQAANNSIGGCPPTFSSRKSHALHVSKYLYFKILEISIRQDDAWDEVTVICRQLINVFKTFERELFVFVKIDILVLCGLFLTASRDPAGIFPPSWSS
jgi:hypothetical protein